MSPLRTHLFFLYEFNISKRLTEQIRKEAVLRAGGTRMLTQKFRDFKQAGVEGIETCKIKSIILPLLADHVLREANHYLRLLED